MIQHYTLLACSILGSSAWVQAQIEMPTPIIATPEGATWFDVVDIDGDGLLDITLSFEGTFWHRNLGDGTFGPRVDISSPSEVTYQSSAGDVDGDGDIDVVADGLLYLNQGDGTFAPSTDLGLSSSGFHWLLDLDGDAYPDLLHSSMSTAYRSLNQGDGTFEPSSVMNPTQFGALINPILMDVDLDGDRDLLAQNASMMSIRWFENDGSANYPNLHASFVEYGADPYYAPPVDHDGDGDLDLLISEFGAFDRYTNNGDGTFTLTQSFSLGWAFSGFVLHDLDGDTDLDILQVTQAGVFEWWENEGAWTFIRHEGPAAAEIPHLFQVADIVGTSAPEIIYHDRQGEMGYFGGVGGWLGMAASTAEHPMDVRVVRDGSDLVVRINGKVTGPVRLLDNLGRDTNARYNLQGGEARIDISGVATGHYIVTFEQQGLMRSLRTVLLDQ